MSRIVGIGAAWLAATLVAVVVAAAAVGSVRSEVIDTPTALAAPVVEAGLIAQPPASDTSTTTSTSIAPEERPPTTVATDSTPPSTVAQPSTPTTTLSPPTTTTIASTTTTVSSYTKTYDTEAGSVRISVSGESVTFSGATPLPGWTVELENSGPEEVKVHFERNEDEDEEDEIEFKAKVEDGELKVSISKED